MKNIEKELIEVKNIRDCSLRPRVVRIQVYKEDLCFRAGMAVARAVVTYVGINKKLDSYECMGIINENFEECFDDAHFEGEDLMFLPFNREIIRCGEHDFIVCVEKCNDFQIKPLYHHIRVYSKVPMLVNRDLVSQPYGIVLPTDREDLVVAGNQFYSISDAYYLTRSFASIKKAAGYPKSFWVQDCLQINGFSECLEFQMNTSFELESGVLSTKTLDFVGFPKTFSEYEMFRLSRLQVLLQEKEKMDAYLRAMQYKK